MNENTEVVDTETTVNEEVEVNGEINAETEAKKAEEENGSRSYQKRINEITRARREAEREAQDARRQAEYYKEMAENNIKHAPKEKEGINVEDFDNYDDYVAALVAERAEKVVDARLRSLDEEDAQAVAQEQHDAVIAQWQERESEFAEKFPDYYEVVGSADDIQVNEATAYAILESERGPEITRHLALNPDLADKLFNMSPVSAARAIGRLEVELETVVGSRAPAPLKKLRGSSGNVQKHPDDMTLQEYEAYRRKT